MEKVRATVVIGDWVQALGMTLDGPVAVCTVILHDCGPGRADTAASALRARISRCVERGLITIGEGMELFSVLDLKHGKRTSRPCVRAFSSARSGKGTHIDVWS